MLLGLSHLAWISGWVEGFPRSVLLLQAALRAMDAQVEIDIDRQAIARLGISVSSIQELIAVNLEHAGFETLRDALLALAGRTDAPGHENLARTRGLRAGDGDSLVVRRGGATTRRRACAARRWIRPAGTRASTVRDSTRR